MNPKHVVITGGAGFIGSHACRALLDRGDSVTAIDNLSTGHLANLDDLASHPKFALRQADITAASTFTDLDTVTHILHLACPASPKANTRMPIDTILAGTVGTVNALDMAARASARIVCVSSSEVYGDPLEHPQPETYRGNCDPIGPYSAYTESKRVLEAACAAHQRQGTRVGIVRPFNVFGPAMWPEDGRVVSSFCAAALRGETLSVAGGRQTRSFTYIADFITGLISMLDNESFGPINLGDPTEITIGELAALVIDVAGTGDIARTHSRDAEVSVRRPNTTRAENLLGWHASTPLREGLRHTLDWMVPLVNVSTVPR
ncbi:NAD-dependent epimerase/dehydratase family protein [Nocardia sp. NPDC052001]|uniref:NAD-dependent epimerase/dehydratase family protein n=1 Tax=Nocardia sp. NPDC052001 TaxID=3154853 RepID=UPI00342FD99F